MNPAPPVTRIRKEHLLLGVAGDSTLNLADWKVEQFRVGGAARDPESLYVRHNYDMADTMAGRARAGRKNCRSQRVTMANNSM